MNYFKDFLALFSNVFDGMPYLQSLTVIFLSLAVAYLLTGTLAHLLERFVAPNQGTFKRRLSRIIQAPIFYTILMVGLSMATLLLPVSDVIKGNFDSFFETINLIILTIFFVRLSKIILELVSNDDSKLKIISIQTLPLFENLVVTVIIVISVYMIFQNWGIDMTAWLASAGVVGVAIGFASKDTLNNFISGIFILSDAPYKIGDFIVLDSGERGEVTDIGIRSTRLLTRDDVELTIPNSIMGNTKVVNESGGPYEKYRIRIPVGVAYGSDVDHVREILMGVATSQQGVCHFPEARVRFRAFGASSLDFELLCWVDKPMLRGRMTDELLTTIYKKFQLNEIEIPYTKQDIYIKEMP